MKVYSSYFSGTGTTEKVLKTLGKAISKGLSKELVLNDFTLNRKTTLKYGKEDLVILGVPTIAGRVPNVLLKYLKTIEGNGALGVPVVLFGNRNFDDALIELRDIMEEQNIRTFAAGAFVGEHSFSNVLAKGRPDKDDMKDINDFAEKIIHKMKNFNIENPINVSGKPYPYRDYYKPQDRQGNHIDIRKVKPVTNSNCNNCKICVEICPMKSISTDDVADVRGICIKCCGCIKKCPQKAKSFIDKGFLYHKEELEEVYIKRKNSKIYI